MTMRKMNEILDRCIQSIDELPNEQEADLDMLESSNADKKQNVILMEEEKKQAPINPDDDDNNNN